MPSHRRRKRRSTRLIRPARTPVGGSSSTTMGVDLIVTDIVGKVSGSVPGSYNAGDHIVFQADVTNQGDVATPSDGTILDVLFRVDSGANGDDTWSDTTTTSLSAGASTTLVANGGSQGIAYWAAVAGSHQITAIVNSVNRIEEPNKTNNTRTETFTIVAGAGTPPTIVNQSPGSGNQGNFYTYTYTATGDATITWSLNSGTLPAGLTLSSAGVLSGNPTTVASYTFTVKASNGAGSAVSNTQTVTIGATPTRQQLLTWLSILDSDHLLSGVSGAITPTLLQQRGIVGAVLYVGANPYNFPSAVDPQLTAYVQAMQSTGMIIWPGCLVGQGHPPNGSTERTNWISGLTKLADMAQANGCPGIAIDCETYASDTAQEWNGRSSDSSYTALGQDLADILNARSLALIIYPSSKASWPGSYNDLVLTQNGLSNYYADNRFQDFMSGLNGHSANVTHTDADFHFGVQYAPDGGDWATGIARSVSLVRSAYPNLKGSAMGWPDIDAGRSFYSTGEVQVIFEADTRVSTGPAVMYQHNLCTGLLVSNWLAWLQAIQTGLSG